MFYNTRKPTKLTIKDFVSERPSKANPADLLLELQQQYLYTKDQIHMLQNKIQLDRVETVAGSELQQQYFYTETHIQMLLSKHQLNNREIDSSDTKITSAIADDVWSSESDWPTIFTPNIVALKENKERLKQLENISSYLEKRIQDVKAQVIEQNVRPSSKTPLKSFPSPTSTKKNQDPQLTQDLLDDKSLLSQPSFNRRK